MAGLQPRLLSSSLPFDCVEAGGVDATGGSADGSASGGSHLALTLPDWVVLACHLTLTLLVGCFVTSRKQSGDDAMLAGRSMSGVTIALSLISGLTSGISYLGFPGYILEDGVGQGCVTHHDTAPGTAAGAR
jgi:hypothetical protein